MSVAAAVLKDRHVVRYFWLIPVRDVFGNRVVWRGQQLRLLPDGRIGEVK